MRVRPFLLLAPLLLASTGFGSPKSHVVEVQDQYSGLREWHLRVSTHHCPGLPSTGEWGAHLDFSAFEEPGRTISFAVAPELDMHHEFKPHGRALLQTLADGVPAQFPQSSDVFVKRSRTRAGKSVSEVIPFALAQKDVTLFSHTQALQFRLDTRDGEVERCAYAKDLRDLGDLLEAASTP